jgi:hypothetical protein
MGKRSKRCCAFWTGEIIENMIIIKLTGGIGNQMFQYSLGRVLSIKKNTNLKLDNTAYEKDYKNKRKYALCVFNIKAEIASNKDLKIYKTTFLKKLIESFMFKLFNATVVLTKNYIKEKNFFFQPEIINVSKEIYLDGYWQSEKYFEDYADAIRDDFKFKDYLMDNQNINIAKVIQSTESISVHVRRGDYIQDKMNFNKIGVCSSNYYNKCFKYILGKVVDPSFFIFSDDISWAKENLKVPCKCTFVDINSGDNGWKDLFLMSQCKHNILANSSFSWWAAWLNKNPKKIIISPDPWFKSDLFDTKDLVPENWIKVKN